MYVRNSYRLSDEVAEKIVQTYNRLALVITSDANDIQATQLPLYYEHGKLIGHIARANSHWPALSKSPPVLIILQGDDAYITPQSYPSKQINGEVVPTWNYQRVDVRGTISTFDDPDRLLGAVSKITDKLEARRSPNWQVSDAPVAFTTRLLRSIIGIEIEIHSIVGKSKMDQDEPVTNQQGVIDTLRQSQDMRDNGVADIMAANLKVRDTS